MVKKDDRLKVELKFESGTLFDNKLLYNKMIDNNYKIRTINNYIWNLNRFDSWCIAKDYKLDDINMDTIKAFVKDVINCSDGGIRARFILYTVLKRYYKIRKIDFSLIEEDFKDISMKKRYPKHNPAEFELSEFDLGRLLDNIDDINVNMFVKTLYYTGLRASECLLMVRSDIGFDDIPPVIHIPDFITKAPGKEKRMVFLPKTLADELKSYINDDDKYVFYLRKIDKKKIKSLHDISKEIMWVNWYLKKSATKAGLVKDGIKDEISCHSLRHCFAHHLKDKGWSLGEIRRAMGHATIDMTDKYLREKDAKYKEHFEKTMY